MATRESFEVWDQLRLYRNLTSHTYDEAKAVEVAAFIQRSAAEAFRRVGAHAAGLVMAGDASYGIAPSSLAKLRAVFDAAPGLQRVWIFGSRARGGAREESDIDLIVEAPGWSTAQFAALVGHVEALNLLYGVDVLRWEDSMTPDLRAQIERDRRSFWSCEQ